MTRGEVFVARKPILGRCYGAVARLMLGGALFGLLSASSRAQEVVAVSEEEFLAPLGPTHPAVVALTEELGRAEAERRRAGALENPTIAFEREAPSNQAAQGTLKLSWRPPLDGRRGLAVDATEASVEAANQNLEWAQLDLRQQFREVHTRWAVAQQRRSLIAAHFESLAALDRRLTVRAARGEESQLTARRFRLAMAELRGELAYAESDLARARGNALTARADLPPGAMPVLSELPRVPQLLEDSVRPDLLAQRSGVEATELRRRLAGRVLEFPTLEFGWTRIGDDAGDFDGPYFGLSWDVPVFDRNQGDRHEYSRLLATQKARLDLTEREAEQRSAAALTSYTALRDSWFAVEAAVEDAPEIATAAGATFLAGESSMTDLLETLRSVLDSQLSALELRAEALAAHRDLELSIGRVLTQGDSR